MEVRNPELLIGLICAAFFTLGVLVVLAGQRLWSGWQTRLPRTSRSSPLEFPCTVCRKPLIFQRQELRPLSGEEIGLVVRGQPKVMGRKLAEYVCPYCEAAHCFAIDRKTPEWVGVNFMQPQQKSAHCFECHKPLRTPPWPEHAYDKRLQEAPQLPKDLGLICSRCNSVCCVGCCESATRGRTADGSFLCPRCFRGPIDLVFHP